MKNKYEIGDVVTEKVYNTFWDDYSYYLIFDVDNFQKKYEVIRIGTNDKLTYTIESLEYFFTKVA